MKVITKHESVTKSEFIEPNELIDKDRRETIVKLSLIGLGAITGINLSEKAEAYSVHERNKRFFILLTSFLLTGSLKGLLSNSKINRKYKLVGNGNIPEYIIPMKSGGFQFEGNGNIPEKIVYVNGKYKLVGNGNIPEYIIPLENGVLFKGNGNMPEKIIYENSIYKLKGNGNIPEEIVHKDNNYEFKGNGVIPEEIIPVKL